MQSIAIKEVAFAKAAFMRIFSKKVARIIGAK
jgi:hypothetical protein